MSEESGNQHDKKCPDCGSPIKRVYGAYQDGFCYLKEAECGSVIDPFYPENETRSELCCEREQRMNLDLKYKIVLRALKSAAEEIVQYRDQREKLVDFSERLMSRMIGKIKPEDWRKISTKLEAIKEAKL